MDMPCALAVCRRGEGCVQACRLPVLRDWKVLAACLSTDARDGLERVHLQDLAALLAASVEVEVASHDAADAAADEDVDAPGEGGTGRKRRSRQKAEEGGDVRQEVSLVLMDVMPGLLRNFANDPHVVRLWECGLVGAAGYDVVKLQRRR